MCPRKHNSEFVGLDIPPRVVRKTPREELLDFERYYGNNMYGDMAIAFEGLLELAKTWRN